MSVMNVRSVLEYVPYFRGRLFVLHVEESLLNARELVDALLDIAALDEMGVRLAIVAAGNTVEDILTQALHCEVHIDAVAGQLADGSASFAQINNIIQRRQVALVAAGTNDRYDESIIQLALKLQADKYICLQDNHIPTRDGKPLYSILESEVALASDCTNWESLQQAAKICRRGIPRVHLLDGRYRGVLLDELFSEEGTGTMVHADSYREIRALRLDDIPELLSMIARCVADAKLYRRSYDDILERMESYYVYTLDDTIVGCIALYPYEEDNSAELGCLFIKHNYEGHGYGRALCAMVEKLAKEQGFSRIFAVSQSAQDYFRCRLNYAPMDRELLPPSRLKQLLESGRQSEVFGQTL